MCSMCSQLEESQRHQIRQLKLQSQAQWHCGDGLHRTCKWKVNLVTIDFLYMRVQLDLCQTADGESVLRSLRRWVRECAPVRKLVSDKGAQFTSRVRDQCRRRGLELVHTYAYDYPRNGIVESCNRSISEIFKKLRMYAPCRAWWVSLEHVKRIVNGRFHRALEMTPFEAFHALLRCPEI